MIKQVLSAVFEQQGQLGTLVRRRITVILQTTQIKRV